MLGTGREAYSYRADPAVPHFPDDKPIIIFDGECVLCSRWAQFVIRHDRIGRYRLLAAQSLLGRALYRHFGLDPKVFETHILLDRGRAWFKSEAGIRMSEGLGFPWAWIATSLRLLPLRTRDRLYDFIASRRYDYFGRRNDCYVPAANERDRFLTWTEG